MLYFGYVFNITLNMKNKLKTLIASLLLTICNITVSAQSTTGYYPLKIVNQAANSKNVTHSYILLMAQDWTKQANNCVLNLSYDSSRNAQVASLVKIQSNTNSRDYTYAVDSLQGYDTTSKSITIYIPHLQSGRCMVSMNYKLYMPIVASTGTNPTLSFQEPSVNDTTDVNNDIIYDKFEFTYDTTAPKTGCFWINPTAVDFFSIPMKMSMNGVSSGNVSNTKRSVIIDTINNVINRYDKSANKTWQKSVITKGSSVVRLVSPSLAEGFDKYYLSDTISYNYIDTVIKYYKTNTLYVDCSEINSGYYGGSIDSNNNWNFINGNDTVVIHMDSVNTMNFFGPGTTPFQTPNKTVRSILVKNITSAFTVNMLPTKNGDTLQKPYNSNYFYKYNSRQNSPKTIGPWYNLYTRALHAAIPIIYAFAYDDVLGQDGTLSCRDTTKPAIVTICDLGNLEIPKHQDLLKVYAATPKTNTGFVCQNGMCTLRVTWQNPPTTIVPYTQPKNAKYFISIAGADSVGFNISADSIFVLQKGKFYDYTDTCGTITLPQSCLVGNYAKMPATVMTCGGPDSPITATPAEIIKNAHGLSPIAPNVTNPTCSCTTNPPSNCNLNCVLRKIWCWLFNCKDN